eukprot:CAMPEP_0176238432 /NCGR_PEP_ID=MMETSP0121_2-20121125/28362_1 /TAXON_ID=160619 /ORGANISM="Kryptoperidinium foliaceum, Strain CCMP 1326" /LENGTH=176 /DNA_ID=CAMNT_0017577907 /DNA_START=244 /DNA_END=772 /DNA_ORIENTATION=-
MTALGVPGARSLFGACRAGAGFHGKPITAPAAPVTSPANQGDSAFEHELQPLRLARHPGPEAQEVVDAPMVDLREDGSPAPLREVAQGLQDPPPLLRRLRRQQQPCGLPRDVAPDGVATPGQLRRADPPDPMRGLPPRPLQLPQYPRALLLLVADEGDEGLAVHVPPAAGMERGRD